MEAERGVGEGGQPLGEAVPGDGAEDGAGGVAGVGDRDAAVADGACAQPEEGAVPRTASAPKTIPATNPVARPNNRLVFILLLPLGVVDIQPDDTRI